MPERKPLGPAVAQQRFDQDSEEEEHDGESDDDLRRSMPGGAD